MAGEKNDLPVGSQISTCALYPETILIHYFFWNSIILDLISSSYPSLNRVRLSLLGGSKLFNIEAKVIIGIVVSKLQIGNK